MSDPDTTEELPPRVRFERSRAGQTIITYVLLLLLAAMVVQNLPSSVVHRDLQPLDDRLNDIGFNQDWTVFSPDPRAESIRVTATLFYPDGTRTVWRVPHKGVFLGAYRDYRWQKWQERVRSDDFARLWEPTARWLVETKRRNGQRPSKVVFTRATKAVAPLYPNGPPVTATPTPAPKWVERVFYTYNTP